MRIGRLVFLIHPFCYWHHAQRGLTPRQWPYGPFEDQRAQAWADAVACLEPDTVLALVPVPGPRSERTAAFCALARRSLGRRFIELDRPDFLTTAFWREARGPLAKGVLEDVTALCTGQGFAWNKEEMETGLHARACAELLQHELDRCGLRVAKVGLRASAWGASFEGCVTKYSLNFARLLGLRQPIEIDFNLTMCDATFLLGAAWIETFPIEGGGRLFLFERKGRGLALFVAERESLGDRPRRVRLAGEGKGLKVTDKRGVRLWPGPVFKPVCADVGLAEPAQPLVRLVEGGLEAPLCAGYVYRMSKAPAYFHAPAGMSPAAFLAMLAGARVVAG